jgi:hypothetical protein
MNRMIAIARKKMLDAVLALSLIFVVLDKNGMSVWKHLLKIPILGCCNKFGQLLQKLYHIFDEHWRFFFALRSIPVITKRNVSGKNYLIRNETKNVHIHNQA